MGATYISFPGKTFLIGEYAVLEGAPAILVNTKPRFLFSVKEEMQRKPVGTLSSYEQSSLFSKIDTGEKYHKKEPLFKPMDSFHPQSPAGQWLKLYPDIARIYQIESRDPYFGKGGFGFSSAQFNLVYLLTRRLKNKNREYAREERRFSVIELNKKGSESYRVKKKSLSNLQKEEDPSFLGRDFGSELYSPEPEEDPLSVWNFYRRLKFPGRKPSGADVVSQWIGGVCLFSLEPFFARSITWPFVDLDFFLIRTGSVLNTHEHLDTLSGKSFTRLSCTAKKAMACVDRLDREGFISALNEYSAGLEERGLVHENTRSVLNRIRKSNLIVTAKGCGAMGAEVVAVFFDSKNKQEVKTFLKKENVMAHSGDLTYGVKIHRQMKDFTFD